MCTVLLKDELTEELKYSISGVRTLNHSTLNHATVNHRLISNIPISEADDDQDVVKITAQPCFPLKRGIIMKRAQRCIARTTK